MQQITIEEISEDCFIFKVMKDRVIVGSGIADNNVEALHLATEKFMELLNKKVL